MASLRDLKKRLAATKTTGQLAGAMRTVGTAKYAKTGAALSAARPFAEACRRLMDAAAAASPAQEREEEPRNAPALYVLAAGNRGLCGGYNHNVFAFFDEITKDVPELRAAACGRMAAEHLKEKGAPPVREFAVSDVTEYAQARGIAEYLLDEYGSGRAGEVYFVYQRFENMLKQTPEIRRFLPAEEDPGEAEDLIFLPDAATVKAELKPYCLTADILALLIQAAAGAHAATVMAMRAAYDNAEKTAKRLETRIHRRRQAEVTQSVLETSGDTDAMRT